MRGQLRQNKKIYFIIVVLSFFILFTGYAEELEETIQQGELVAFFGNARFTVVSGFDIENNYIWTLYDNELDIPIDKIYAYDERENSVYFLGEKGFGKLDYLSGEYQLQGDINSYEVKDQTIFREIRQGKGINKKKSN